MSVNRVVQFLDGWPGENAPAVPPDIPEASGSSYATLSVDADGGGMTRLPDGSAWVGHVYAQLQKVYNDREGGESATYIVIQKTEAIRDGDDERQQSVRLELLGPGALRGLIRTLMELEANPIGAKILAEIEPSAEGMVTRDEIEGKPRPRDDDDLPGDEWKRGAPV